MTGLPVPSLIRWLFKEVKRLSSQIYILFYAYQNGIVHQGQCSQTTTPARTNLACTFCILSLVWCGTAHMRKCHEESRLTFLSKVIAMQSVELMLHMLTGLSQHHTKTSLLYVESSWHTKQDVPHRKKIFINTCVACRLIPGSQSFHKARATKTHSTKQPFKISFTINIKNTTIFSWMG